MQTHSRKFRSCFLFASFQCMQEGFRTLPSGEITGTYGEGFCGVTDQGNFEDHGVDGEVLQYLVDAGNRIHTQDFAMLADHIGKRNKRKKVDYCKYLKSITRGQFLLLRLFQHYIGTALATIRTAHGGVVVLCGMGEAQRLVMKLGPICGEEIPHRNHSEYLMRFGFHLKPSSAQRTDATWRRVCKLLGSMIACSLNLMQNRRKQKAKCTGHPRWAKAGKKTCGLRCCSATSRNIIPDNEKGKQEGRLDTKNQAQAGNSEKGAASIMVAMVGLWNPSQKDATGDDWIKAVKVALDNYWASPQGQAAKQAAREKDRRQVLNPKRSATFGAAGKITKYSGPLTAESSGRAFQEATSKAYSKEKTLLYASAEGDATRLQISASMHGNKNRPTSILDTAYVSARTSQALAFDQVLLLKPPPSLFHWKTVHHLPIKKHITSKTFSNTPKNLAESIRSLEGPGWAVFFPEKNQTPQSTHTRLLGAFKTLRAAIVTWKNEDSRITKRKNEESH